VLGVAGPVGVGEVEDGEAVAVRVRPQEVDDLPREFGVRRGNREVLAAQEAQLEPPSSRRVISSLILCW